jgi:hypothetical protein
LYSFIYANLIALALPVGLWVWIELRRLRPRLDGRPTRWAIHEFAAGGSIAVLGFVTVIGVISDFIGASQATTTLIGGLAVLATGVAVVSCLWDVRAQSAVATLYTYGLILVGIFLDALDLQGDRLLFTGAIVLGAFTLATSYLWSRRRGLQQLEAHLRMPAREAGSGLWIRSFTTVLVAGVLALAFWVELVCPDQALRISAGQAAIFQAFALGMLAAGGRRRNVQRDALLVGMLGVVVFSWAFVAPDDAHGLLNRSVATCVSLAVTAIFYALGIAKLPLKATDWVEAAQRFAPAAVVALIAAVLVTLGQETVHSLVDGAVPLAWPGILAVAITLLAIFAASLAAALLPGRDPLGLSERGRMSYVYAAEVMLALAFLHVRVTMSWLFTGLSMAYWPLIVMAIAYLGVGLGE